ncbi:hypothetical protein GCM10010249_59490 [Streptomyces roseolilacinus]|uniref:Uncharacterized protein n=1 Tax=Streptomyces roseolilacinus TaxID=66904 RepID=A0A918EQ33_9ACTN|nr:hypothetical protein GCM10010249_59490 [Streptomyces roseolilacinus]
MRLVVDPADALFGGVGGIGKVTTGEVGDATGQGIDRINTKLPAASRPRTAAPAWPADGPVVRASATAGEPVGPRGLAPPGSARPDPARRGAEPPADSVSPRGRGHLGRAKLDGPWVGAEFGPDCGGPRPTEAAARRRSAGPPV